MQQANNDCRLIFELDILGDFRGLLLIGYYYRPLTLYVIPVFLQNLTLYCVTALGNFYGYSYYIHFDGNNANYSYLHSII